MGQPLTVGIVRIVDHEQVFREILRLTGRVQKTVGFGNGREHFGRCIGGR